MWQASWFILLMGISIRLVENHGGSKNWKRVYLSRCMLMTKLHQNNTSDTQVLFAGLASDNIWHTQWRIYIVNFWTRPPGQIFSISCILGENLAKSYVGAPSPEGWRPHLEEILNPPLTHFNKKQGIVWGVLALVTGSGSASHFRGNGSNNLVGYLNVSMYSNSELRKVWEQR